jgi:putative FmdB family regulatory protein
MPVYEYYCRTCKTKFEKLRPMSASEQSVDCPSGHEGAMRTLSLVARVGGSAGYDFMSAGDDLMPSGGGCACGGACSCGAR